MNQQYVATAFESQHDAVETTPLDDNTTIRELNRLCRSGVGFMVFGWPAFRWLEYYSGLYNYLRSQFHCILNNGRLVVFNYGRNS